MPDFRDDSPSAPSNHLLNLLTATPHLDTFLDRTVHLAADIVDPPAYVGLTLQDDQPFTVHSSDPLAIQLDQIQYGQDQGPCLDCVRQGTVVQADDLTGEQRWQAYAAHAVAHGVISSLSLPVTVDRHTVASLNFYSPRPAAFDGPSRSRAQAFAGQCAFALALSLRLTGHPDDAQHRKAASSGSTVDPAAQSRKAALRAAQIRRETADVRQRVASARQQAAERVIRSTILITTTKQAIKTSRQRRVSTPDE